MADFEIAVTPVLRPNNKYCVDVSNDDIEIDYNTTKTIRWTVDTGQYPGATITKIDFRGNPPWGDQIPSNPTNSIQITDTDDDAHAGKTFNYVVHVSYDGHEWASDPKIVNKPKTSGTNEMGGTA